MRRLILAAFAAVFAALSAIAQESTGAIRCEFVSDPAGADIIIDGVLRNGKTPEKFYDIGPGRHHIRFELRGYEPFDDLIVLRGGEFVVRKARLKPIKGLLLITTEPDGCDVSLDGVSLGTTPRLIASLNAKDSYRLLLQKTGYQPRPVDVKFDGRIPLVKHERLIIDSGIIEITSDPAGAEVMVNGQPRGFTPTTVRDVPKGQAVVMIEKPGFVSQKRELSIVAGESQTLAVKLEGIPGTMRLIGIPDGVFFYINGQPEGKGPISKRNMKPGTYEIRAALDGYAPVTRMVTIGNGGSVTEEFRLENIMGRIELRTVPGGVKVTLDDPKKGGRVGFTKIRPHAAEDEPSDVLVFDNIMEGQHTLIFQCEGYAEMTKHPVVENSKVKQMSVRMKRVFIPNVLIVTEANEYRCRLIRKLPTGEMEVEIDPSGQGRGGLFRTFKPDEIIKIEWLDGK